MITFTEYNNISAVEDEAALSVDSSGITTYEIAEGKKGVSFLNRGSGSVHYGGATTVNPSTNRGHILRPNQGLVYKNVKNTFTIGFRCATGETATISIVNHN